ncbi:MAG: hypothetical protein H6999_06405 [Hahellaceae bacterium]|nr:hypothetical protein [Hahellaceae bacterium]MCP5169373.1 hypothetical protein [Hahellaceae bacterium]
MDRRSFIKTGLAGAAAGSLLPVSALADHGHKAMMTPMAGSLYYTEANPGRWSAKAGGHLPHIKVEGSQVQVVTGHEMKGYEHYIVKHILFDAHMNILGEKLFDPTKDQPISDYTLPAGYKGTLYALSMCNKHDVWLNSLDV